MEDQTEKLVRLWLDNDSPWILGVNVLLIALIPAISEELIFRGFLQTILASYSKTNTSRCGLQP
jgi:membrane protease YdiL (CAAX protease family)